MNENSTVEKIPVNDSVICNICQIDWLIEDCDDMFHDIVFWKNMPNLCREQEKTECWWSFVQKIDEKLSFVLEKISILKKKMEEYKEKHIW